MACMNQELVNTVISIVAAVVVDGYATPLQRGENYTVEFDGGGVTPLRLRVESTSIYWSSDARLLAN